MTDSDTRTIRALICDLDNTIFPATAIPAVVLRPAIDAIVEANRAVRALDDGVLESVLAECWHEPFDRVATRHELPRHLREAWTAASRGLRLSGPLSPYPDVHHLGRIALRRFLVTTGYLQFQHDKIAALGIAPLFEEIFVDALDEPGTPGGKTRIFKSILDRFRLAPSEVAVVGDSAESEIAAGRELGMPTVQILRDGTLRSEATFHIESFADLASALRAIEVARRTNESDAAPS